MQSFQTNNELLPAIDFQIYKGRDGWAVQTPCVQVKGYCYQISGYKGRQGFYVSAKQVQKTDAGYSMALFTAPNYVLFPSTQGMVTEKFVKNACAAAALAFGVIIPELPTKTIYEVGYAFVDAAGTVMYWCKENDLGESQVIYANEDGKIRTTDLTQYMVRDETKDSKEAVLRLQEIVTEQQTKDREAMEKASEAASILAAAKKDVFLKFKPSWAVSAIVAELHEDESDLMTDYFSYSTAKSVVIAWSRTDRNDFSEMRQAAANFPDTLHLATYSEELEHRENYSMGAGLYLGKSKYHGWIIKKTAITHHFGGMTMEIAEHLQIPGAQLAIAQGEDEARISHNKAQGGVELFFEGKPSEGTLSTLKANGFRWARGNKCWYKKVNSGSLKVASQFGQLPDSLKPEQVTANNNDADYVAAQEEAFFDNNYKG